MARPPKRRWRAETLRVASGGGQSPITAAGLHLGAELVHRLDDVVDFVLEPVADQEVGEVALPG